MRVKVEKIRNWGISSENMLYIAGPCSVESEESILQTALSLAKYKVNVLRAGVWKPRTRPGSFEGVGRKGLRWLKKAGCAANLPVAVEVAQPEHVKDALNCGIDILWIGARTTANPFSVQAIADVLKGTDIPVMVKNPVSPDIELWIGAIERLNKAGITKLAAVHRGFSTSSNEIYRNKPEWRIPIELKRRLPSLPIICDPSHICGKTELLFSVAQEAMDLLYNGLMIEVHINPPSALSDSEQQITPEEYGQLIEHLTIKKVSTKNQDYQQHIKFLRQEIDEVDKHLIELLAKRMNIVRKISFYKKKSKVSFFQPDRWKEIVESRIKAGMEKKLSKDFMLRIYQSIHEEAIRQQEEEV